VGLIPGLMQSLGSLFKGADKEIRSKTELPDKPFPAYPTGFPVEERILWLCDQYYWQTTYEKLQMVRKWFRNHLFYCGYHTTDFADMSVAFAAVAQAPSEYAFASNYYRSYIRYGAAMYVQTAPEFIAQPSSEDPVSQGVAQAARAALDVIKENVAYDDIRARESVNLRIYGNSFRYSYFSADERYGFVTRPVYEDVEIALDDGNSSCGNCGQSFPGQLDVCPQCGPSSPVPISKQPPTMATVPKLAGKTTFPRGQEMSEVVWPFEIGVRSSSKDLWHAPFLNRSRMVDRAALQATFPKLKFGGEEIPGSGASGAEDISLTYQQSVAQLPSDPLQSAGWYETVTAPSKCLFLETWIRPSQYFFDKELLKKFPKGLYAGKVESKLATTRNESLDDHWVHFKHIHVEGRFWGDGDDDLIPESMKNDEVDRLILRHVEYNTLPLLMVDSQRVDKNNIINDAGYQIEVKSQGGKPIRDAAEWLPGGQLSQDVYIWKKSLLENMQFHSGVSPAAIGQHEPGINTFGGQETAAQRSQAMLGPLQLMYKEGNELWAMQMLKICSENWLDDRVKSTMGANGQWEFKKLRGEMLSLDQIRVQARIIPLDFSQQQSFTQAIAAGAFNPQLPGPVRRKVLELYQVSTELDDFSNDAKVQYKEIEQMKQGQAVEPVLIKDNDDVHIRVLRDWMNSDDYDDQPPQVKQLAYQHLLAHVQNKANLMQAMGEMQANSGQQPGQQQPGQNEGNPNNDPQFRQRRAQAGQAAKPKRPQPSGGNGSHIGRPGMSQSAQQRRRNP
jgi:hypothetical protein